MSLNMNEISPELKAQLMDLKNLSPMQRFAVVTRPRQELKWRTVAVVYGMEKLEAQKWIIPDEELTTEIRLTTKDTKEHKGEASQPQIKTENTDQEQQSRLTAEIAEGA